MTGGGAQRVNGRGVAWLPGTCAEIRLISPSVATAGLLIGPKPEAVRYYEARPDGRCALMWRCRTDTAEERSIFAGLLNRLAGASAEKIVVGGAIVAGMEAWSEQVEQRIIQLAHTVADIAEQATEISSQTAPRLAARVEALKNIVLFWRDQRGKNLQYDSATPVAVAQAVSILLHDLPINIFTMMSFAVGMLQQNDAVPPKVIERLRACNVKTDLFRIARAALAEASEELALHGCPSDPSMVVDESRSPHMSAIHVTLEGRGRLRHIVRNLLSNGARYCLETLARWAPSADDPPAAQSLGALRQTADGLALLAQTRRVEMWMRQLPGGAVEVTCEDNGIGLHPDAIAELGRHGFMIGKKIVAGQSGTGLTSVIEKGWGPLFYKVHYAPDGTPCGTSFRCYVGSVDVVTKSVGTTTWRDVIAANAADGFLMLPQSMDKLPKDLDAPV